MSAPASASTRRNPYTIGVVLYAIFSIITCVLLFLSRYQLRATGALLKPLEASNPAFSLGLAGIMFGVPCFILFFISLYAVLKKKVVPKLAWLLFAPVALIFILDRIAPGSFDQGVVNEIRAKATEAELTTAARNLTTASPAWLDAKTDEANHAGLWVRSEPALARLNPTGMSRVLRLENGAGLEWGAADQLTWGIAISSEPGVSPKIPDGTTATNQAYPSVVVYSYGRR